MLTLSSAVGAGLAARCRIVLLAARAHRDGIFPAGGVRPPTVNYGLPVMPSAAALGYRGETPAGSVRSYHVGSWRRL